MPFTEKQSSSVNATSFGRSILSFGRGQIHSPEGQLPTDMDLELDAFQKFVSDNFQDLTSSLSTDEFLSLSWVRKLLDAFIGCQEQFGVILTKNKAQVMKPPLDRYTSEFFERSVKALDICNATRDGIDKIRQWEKHLQIVCAALDSRQRALGEGQFRRARKALMELALVMIDEKDSGSVVSHRNRSFGRHNSSKNQASHSRHSRSLSWSVSRSWSASKQLQSIASNLVAPRGNDLVATQGLVVPVFTMSYVLLFVLWALVAAIPCQDRNLQIHFSIPRQYLWGGPLFLLHEKIMEESKKRERKNSHGLLKEIYQIEKCTRHMTDLIDSAQFPLSDELKEEIQRGVDELALVCEAFNSELDPLERLVREVFRKIMTSRTEGLELLNRANHPE